MAILIIAAIVALVAGWHFSQASMAHRAIPGRRSQFGGMRKDRTHHLLWVVGIVVLAAVVVAIVH
jgi:hypothetical protein